MIRHTEHSSSNLPFTLFVHFHWHFHHQPTKAVHVFIVCRSRRQTLYVYVWLALCFLATVIFLSLLSTCGKPVHASCWGAPRIGKPFYKHHSPVSVSNRNILNTGHPVPTGTAMHSVSWLAYLPGRVRFRNQLQPARAAAQVHWLVSQRQL